MNNQLDSIQACIDHLTAAIIKMAPDGTVFMVNNAAADLTEVSTDELLGRKLWETPLWAKSDRDQAELKQGVEDAVAGRSSHFEFSYRPDDECYTVVDLSVKPVFDQNGELLYIVGEARDISDFRRVEAALRESEERFRNIFENAPIGIFQATLDGRFVVVNTTLARAFGYDSPDEIMTAIPSHFAESLLLHSERWEGVLRTVIGAEGFCRFENEHRRKDGSVFIANVYIRAVREGERVVILEGFEEDITERVHAEERLADEKKLSETIINAFPGLFYMINQQGKMIWWNEYRDRHFAYSVDEQGYSDVLAYVLEADRPLAAAAMAEAFAGEQASVELRLPHKDGEVRDYYATGAQVNVGGEPRIVGVAVDITERKHAEEQKRAFYRETIKSVTQGKLDLVPRDEVQGFLDATGYSRVISHAADITSARAELETFYESKGLGGEVLKSYLAGIGEAMTNAVKHAGSGRVYAGAGVGSAWSAVVDKGPGIAALTVPSATLRRGFSTKTSLGMGYSIILDSSDRVSLATGPEGTTVVMVKDVAQPEPEVSLDDLHDTWDELPVP